MPRAGVEARGQLAQKLAVLFTQRRAQTTALQKGAGEFIEEKLDVLEVLTLDRRGFSTYRNRDGRAFVIVLDQE